MKIALYGQTINPDFYEELIRLFDLFHEKQIESFIYKPFNEYLKLECGIDLNISGVFENGDDLPEDVSFLLSLGGDGTLLKSFIAAQNRSIPHVGINSGRLGFLSDISREEIETALKCEEPVITTEKDAVRVRSIAGGSISRELLLKLHVLSIKLHEDGSLMGTVENLMKNEADLY